MTEQPRVRTGRLSTVATIAMIVLAIFTLLFVNVVAGIVLLILGVAMYIFNFWFGKRMEARS